MPESAKQKLENYFEPMLCLDAKESDLDNPLYIGTIKMDGTMIVIENLEDGFKFYSRRGLTYNSTIPEITEAFGKIQQSFRVIGELVYIDSEGHQVFRGSQIRCQIGNKEKVEEYRKLYPVGVFLFDITNLNGIDLTKLPFIKRWNILMAFHKLYSELLGWNNVVRLVPISMEKRKMYEYAKSIGLEGLVLRKLDGIYEVGKRSPNMIKLKCREHSIFTLKDGEWKSKECKGL
jgi:ATP-dependent DNA ligase